MNPRNEDTAKRERRLLPGESAFGWMLLAFGAFAFSQAYAIDGFSSLSSAGGTPMAAAAIVTLSAAVVIISNRKRAPLDVGNVLESAQRFGKEMLPLQPLVVYVAAVFAYMAALEPLGFNASTFLFLFFSFWYLHHKNAWAAFSMSTLTMAVIFIVFRVIFQIVLPEGDLIDAALRTVGWR
jgi:putative tricarboxylic transport membrane protein